MQNVSTAGESSAHGRAGTDSLRSPIALGSIPSLLTSTPDPRGLAQSQGPCSSADLSPDPQSQALPSLSDTRDLQRRRVSG